MTTDHQPADICLILEGTYPYVTGGVSIWTHRLITNLPELRFHLLCLVPDERPRSWAYPMPENVVGQTDITLSVLPEEVPALPFQSQSTPKSLFHEIETFHHMLLKGDTSGFPKLYQRFDQEQDHKKLFHDLLTSQESWKILQNLYTDQFHEESFIDFFWMWRTTHIPLFRVLSTPIPDAGIYHCLSTGYAGMLGVMGHLSNHRPLLLTEHGIYTRERRIEIALAEWIGGTTPEGGTIRPVNETVRGFWMRIFEQIGKIVYQHADPIITLFEGNRAIEIREGANPDKIQIIPNGIDLASLPRKQSKPPGSPWTVALIGRVVPIKDIKTFIQAAHLVRDQEPSVKFIILGPTDHDPDYYAECLDLLRSLSLEETLSFTGSVNLSLYYPQIDILALTSLSEAQPLVIMEAGGAGIPVVASRVGACEELLIGRTDPDRALGPSGLLTSVGSPQETALSILRLIRDPDLASAMGNTGRRRMDLFYKESDVFDTYRKIYQEKMAGWPE
ncbi:MAG: GT4 family glycosyltransferase PelF [Leptospirales bacterium]